MAYIKKESILFVSYYFPPIQNVATKRIINLYLESDKYFKKRYVSTTSNRFLLKKDPSYDLKFDNLIVNKTWDYRRFARKSSNTFGFTSKGGVSIFIRKILESFPTNIVVGEGGLIYILSSYRVLSKLILKNEIDYIFSSFRPFADHYIAFLLKLRHPKLFWIADFRDFPINSSLNNTYFPRFQAWFLRLFLRRTDLVTCVSEGVKEGIPFAGETMVLRNAVSDSPEIIKLEKYDKFTISYTGSVYPKEHDPEILFQSVHRMLDMNVIDRSEIQIIYAGNSQEFWNIYVERYNLSDVFYSFGMISHTEALEIQSRSHVNLLMTYCHNDIKGDISAKIWEYLRWDGVILGITKGGVDKELGKIVDDTKSGIVFQHTQSQMIYDFMVSMVRKWQMKEDISTPSDISKYKWPSNMNCLINKLDLLAS